MEERSEPSLQKEDMIFFVALFCCCLCHKINFCLHYMAFFIQLCANNVSSLKVKRIILWMAVMISHFCFSLFLLCDAT